MQRQKLIEILADVRPALATNDLVPVLTHLWFSGKRVLACNDVIAISAPCATGEFSGAVPGVTLLSVLQASRAAEVEFAPDESEVVVQAGKSRLTLPLLPVEKFPFEMPEPGKEAETLPVNSSEFVAAIESCLRSVSKDTSVPDQLGVTVIPGKKNLLLYATNGITITHVPIAFKDARRPLARRVVIPALFCEQLVRLARQDKAATLIVAEDYALLSTSGGARLYGKLVDVERPLDFPAQIKDVVPESAREQAVDVPPGLASVLERALVIADPTGERVRTQISVKGGKAEFVTKSARGEMRDKLKFDGHPDASASVDAQWLKVGADFDKILLTEGAVIMRNGRELYLVATTS